MKSALAIFVAMAAGIVAGLGIAESTLCHKIIARWIRGVEPVAIVHGVGVDNADAIPDAVLNFRARAETISPAAVDHEVATLREQFADDARWNAALRANHLATWQLRRALAENLRGCVWLDRQLHLAVSDEECRTYFAQHPEQFAQPIRYHVAHLFVAAPAGSPDELVATKRQTIDQLAQRLQSGEKFADLAAQFSEDEATKKRGGDLGWICDARMPTDFMNAVHALPVGQTSGVIQTKLGFHILRLDEIQPQRSLSFEEARPEISLQIENAKRRDAVRKLVVDLASDAPVVQSE